jgi:radical SAM protein with 4Fe4S-binding SPASM domain
MDLTPSPEEYEWVLNHIWDITEKYKGKFEVHVHCPHFARVVKQRLPETDFNHWYEKEFHGKCTYFAFGGYLSVTENGDLIPCFYTDLQPSEPMMLGNIRSKSLSTAWEEIKASPYYNKFQNRKVLKGKCGVCEYIDICGGCRNRAYAYTGDLTESDPACVYIPEKLRKKQ